MKVRSPGSRKRVGSMVDPIADMLTRIRNALAVGRYQVEVPYSNTKLAIAKVLKRYGFITGIDTEGEDKKTLVLKLGDGQDGRIVREIHRVSKPGRRVYVTTKEIPSVLGGRGIVVVSTSQGVMCGNDAHKKGVGGELMCKVW